MSPIQPAESTLPIIYRAAQAAFEDQETAHEVGQEILAHPEQLVSEVRMFSLICNVQRVVFGVLALLFAGYSGVLGVLVTGALALISHETYSFLDKLLEGAFTKREFLEYDGRFSVQKFQEFWGQNMDYPQICVMEVKGLLEPAMDNTLFLSLLKDDLFRALDEEVGIPQS